MLTSAVWVPAQTVQALRTDCEEHLPATSCICTGTRALPGSTILFQQPRLHPLLLLFPCWTVLPRWTHRGQLPTRHPLPTPNPPSPPLLSTIPTSQRLTLRHRLQVALPRGLETPHVELPLALVAEQHRARAKAPSLEVHFVTKHTSSCHSVELVDHLTAAAAHSRRMGRLLGASRVLGLFQG